MEIKFIIIGDALVGTFGEGSCWWKPKGREPPEESNQGNQSKVVLGLFERYSPQLTK